MYFVSDVDGTLLAQPGDRVKAGVAEALETIQKCGVKVVLASGRALHDITLAAERLGLENYYAIAGNGRCVAKMYSAEVVKLIYSNYDVSLGMVLAKEGKRVIFQGADGGLRHLDAGVKPANLWKVVASTSEFELMTTAQSSFMVEFEGTWEQAQHPSFSKWHPWKYAQKIYLQDMSITKATGLLELVRSEGREGIAVIGDDINDLPLLNLADDAYLMGNASAELRSRINRARKIVGDVESGGVIDAIDDLMAKYPSLRIALKRGIKSGQRVLEL